jgi:hypothetical protein
LALIAPFPIDDISKRLAIEIGAQIGAEDIYGAMPILVSGARDMRPAPTALFVLERVSQAGLPPRTLLTAMGPGFTASCVSLKRAA